MHIKNGEAAAKEKVEIHWEESDKHVIIGYLLMSIDKKLDPDKTMRLDDLFGLSEDACKDEAEIEEKRKTGETIINECEKFLAAVDDSDRYDIIADEIDKFIENGDSPHCGIGASYQTWNDYSAKKLSGGPYALWGLVKLVIDDSDYAGNKKRLLEHLVRKWNIGSDVLPKLEAAAKAFSAIEKERLELKASDRPYREVVEALAALGGREKEVRETLKVMDLNNVGALDDEDAESEGGEYDEDGGEDDFWGELGDKVNMGLLDFFDGIATGIEKLAAKL
jgi:hypothetical protein